MATQPDTTEEVPERKPRNPFNPRANKPVDPIVFSVALGLILVFVILGAIFPGETGDIADTALNWVITNFGWLFIFGVAGFVAFTLLLGFSRYGRIPLGKSGEKPEFKTVSWIALMFGAGMGVGLVFYGVAEPISHLTEPVPGSGNAPGSNGAARDALQFSFFHWGIQPWAIYGVVGLALAYSTYRKGRGNLLSAPFAPVIGDPNRGVGRAINTFAIVVTKFGSATSLGLAGLEIAAGLSYVFGIDATNDSAVIVILVMTVIFVVLAVSGVEKGMKHASNANLVLAFLLMLFVFIAGPTVLILNELTRSSGDYLFNFITMTFHTAGFGSNGALSWLSDWTIFYWAWWVSWALHVGTFLARVSRGRTIRQFVAGVVIVPTMGSMVWYSILGGTAMHLQQTGQTDIAAAQASGGKAAALFSMLQSYPAFTATGILAIILVAIFFITGADTGAIVLGMLSSYGRPDPRHTVSVIWGVMSAAVAIVLIYVGGLEAIQTFVILAASPFIIVMALMAMAFFKDLRHDPLRQQINPPVRPHAPDLTEDTNVNGMAGNGKSGNGGTATSAGAGGSASGASPRTVE